MAKSKRKQIHADTAEAKAHAKKEKQLRRRLILIVAGCLLFIIAASALITSYQHRAKPKTSFQAALGIKANDQTEDTIRSNLKFSVRYNNKIFKPVAYVVHEDQTFVTVDGKDVLKPNDYGVVYLYSNNLKKGEYDLGRTSELGILTNIHADFFDRRAADPAYGKNLSQLDTTEKFFKPKDLPNGKYTEVKRGKVTINGVDYRKVTYNFTDNKYITSNHTFEYYYTVQNNRPYAISINRSDDPDQEFVSALRSLIGNVKYGEESQSASYGSANSGDKGKTTSDQYSGANLPSNLLGETALKVAAKNQPAVVRIGTNYCAGITLLLPNKQEYMKLPVSCSPVIGSGSIVSSDGYISTNGHVTRSKPADALMAGLFISAVEEKNTEPLIKYLNYLVATGIMSRSQLASLLTAAQGGDAEANSKLQYSAELIPKSNIVVNGEYTQYAIQLGNDPLRISRTGTKFNFNYGKTIVKAKYVDSDFDVNAGSEGKSDIYNSTSSDVSILKIQGSNYPVLKLGSVDSLKKDDLITAIGYPAFVDDGLDTKLKHTVPTVTQGRITIVDYDSVQKVRKIIGSTTPIAPGNSGGPAVADNSTMAGLNTYGSPDCEDNNCFASQSVFRDVADFKALLAKNKITLKDNSNLTTEWSRGIDLFAEGKYSEANDIFINVRSQYPAFYLADSFINQANDQIDAQIKSRNLIIGISLLVVLIIVGCITAFFTFRNLRKHKRQGRANGYYVPAPSQQYAPQSPQPQTYFAPAIPVNSAQQQPQAQLQPQATLTPVSVVQPPQPQPQPQPQPTQVINPSAPTQSQSPTAPNQPV